MNSTLSILDIGPTSYTWASMFSTDGARLGSPTTMVIADVDSEASHTGVNETVWTFEVTKATPVSDMNVSITQASSKEAVDDTISFSNAMVILYLAIGVLGLCGNFLVVLVLGSAASLRSTITNMFVISQSCIDALVSLCVILSIEIDSDVPFSGLAGEIYCRVWLNRLPLWWFMLASTYNLVALSIERYLNVVHPIWHKVWFSSRVAKGIMIFIVLVSFIHLCYTTIPTTGVVQGVCMLYYKWPSVSARQAWGISVVILRFFIPLFVFIYTYTSIAYVIHKKIQKKQQNAPPGSAQTAALEKWSRSRKNTIKTLALVSLMYLLCWGPNQIYFFMFNVGYPPDYSSDFYHLSVSLTYLNCAVNPFIYAVQYEQFYRAARHLFCRPFGGLNRVGDSSSSSTA